ncbi:hypothetical protein F5Y11DRAFT_331153 [Daldinia sp. FL1419]|nr:hypothetical protein F5Y11DRAFT_331153 [Daldinia sp. FL1419]
MLLCCCCYYYIYLPLIMLLELEQFVARFYSIVVIIPNVSHFTYLPTYLRYVGICVSFRCYLTCLQHQHLRISNGYSK